MESKKALAAVFEMHTSNLDINTAAMNTLTTNSRGRKFGFAGAIVGLISAYIGITMSLTSGYITSNDAGLYYGGVGAFCGICCAVIGVLSSKRTTNDA